MGSSRRHRRRSPLRSYALVALGLVGLVGGVAAIVIGVNSVFQSMVPTEPLDITTPSVTNTPDTDSVTTFQPDVDGLVLEPVDDVEQEKPVIVLDPGHGGTDGGTVGIIIEKEMTTAVTQKLYDLLMDDGRFTVIVTRSLVNDVTYVPLKDRVEIAVEAEADLFFSIHGNAFDGEMVRGTECFPIPPGYDYHEESIAFAKLIVAGLEEEGAKLRGETGVRYAYFDDNNTLYYGEESSTEKITDPTYYVLQRVEYPAVLIEQCYISSEEDMALFGGEEGYAMSAQVYYESICTYFYPDEVS